MNRGNGGIFGKKNSTSVVGGMYSSYEQQEKSASVYWPSGPDSNFAYTPLLLKTRPQASPKTTVTDSSVNNLVVTKNGNQSAGWTSPYQTVGYWSNYFGGSGNYLYKSNPGGGQFDPGNTGTWTIEMWVYPISSFNFFGFGSGGIYGNAIACEWSTNSFQFAQGNGSNANPVVIRTATNYPANAWYHFACVKDSSNNITLYINGISAGTATNVTATIASGCGVIVNGLYDNNGLGNNGSTCYLSNIRWIKGQALTSGNFTPPTAPLLLNTVGWTGSNAATSITGTVNLLTCQSNRFIDNSGNNFAVTVAGTPRTFSDWYPTTFSGITPSIGAGYNGIKTDFYSIPNTAAITTLAGDFTIETWVYPTDTSATATSFAFIETRTGGATAAPWVWGMGTYTSAGWITGFFTGTSYNFTSRVLPYVWTHVVLQRNGSTLRTFINGVVDATTFTLAGTITGGSSTIYIGNSKDNGLAGYGALGYFSDFRVVNGTAVYNVTGFTAPTSQLTAVANTTLLLNFSDTNTTSITDGANNNVFIDSSPYALTLTRNGTPTQGSFTPYLPNGSWSNYLDGSSYVNFGINSYLTTGPCTVEMWINCSSFSTSPIIIDNANWNIGQNCGWFLNIGTDGRVYFNASTGTFNVFPNVVTTTKTITTGTWNHIAFVRDVSNVCRIYINGVDGGGSVTYSASFNLNSGTSYRGTELGRHVADGGTYNQYTGYISNLRIVNNAAVYTSTFTPPDVLTAISGTSLLTSQSNRFVDNSVNNASVTLTGTPKVQNFQPIPSKAYSPSLYGGSGYFNGSSDSVSTSQTFALPTSTTPFTMEAWVYFSTFSSVTIASSAYAGSGPIPFVMGMGSGNGGTVSATPWFGFFTGSAWGTTVQSSTSLSLNTWYHIACVYTGSTATIYANGVSIATASVAAWQVVSQAGFYIGRRWDTASPGPYFNGYISNFRFVIGTAVYTGTFTPPTLAPLTFDGQTSASSYANTANVNTSFGKSQTVLLTNFNNTAIYDTSTQNDVVTIGSSQVGNTPSKFPSITSMRFNGSTDYLYVPGPAANPPFTFGTGDFTIEMWVFVNAYSASLGTLYDTRPAGTASTSGYLVLGMSNVGTLTYQTAATTVITAGSNLSLGVWYHVALCRSSGSSRLFINGTQTGSTYADSNNLSSGANRPAIGSDSNVPLSAGYVFNGFIQDFRLSKIGRYTSNFSAPTLPFGSSGRALLGPIRTVEYLVVAGGGGAFSGGGGGGGYQTSSTFIINQGTQYIVTVGAGGPGGSGSNGTSIAPTGGSNGSNSVFSIITSIGGGLGGYYTSTAGQTAGASGGSGGGAGHGGSGQSRAGGAGTSGQGNAGGNNFAQDGNGAAGGGGGAGAVGAAAGSQTGGAGGIGIQSSISGVSTYYAGGGGGWGQTTLGAGTLSTGGGAAAVGPSPGGSGLTNTGGGAGGFQGGVGTGGTGGSGIVIIAYPSSIGTLSTVSSGLTYTVDTTTRSGYTVYKFTAGTGTISW